MESMNEWIGWISVLLNEITQICFVRIDHASEQQLILVFHFLLGTKSRITMNLMKFLNLIALNGDRFTSSKQACNQRQKKCDWRYCSIVFVCRFIPFRCGNVKCDDNGSDSEQLCISEKGFSGLRLGNTVERKQKTFKIESIFFLWFSHI